MIDPERIRSLAARMGNREDALRLVRQMRCGGKKFETGGPRRRGLFDREKVANRVPGDGFFYGGTNGVSSAVLGYLLNGDTFVEDRLRDMKEAVDSGRMSEDHYKSLVAHEDAKRLYLGLPQLYGSLEPSPYRPTIGRMDNPYQVNGLLTDKEFENTILPMYATWKSGQDWPLYRTGYRVKDLGRTAQLSDMPYLHRAGMSEGFDDNGQYISLQDVWDYNTWVKNKSGDNVGKWVGGKPFDIYQRYYLDDWLDIPEEARGNPYIAPSYIEADYTGPKYGCGGKKFDGGGKYFRTDLGQESPMMYEPMMPVYPDVQTPLRYYPQPNYGDYEYPSSTGMVQSMPIQTGYVPVSAGVPVNDQVVPEPDLFSDEAIARRALKQRWAESSFNDKAVSKAGAMGAWQIMPITLKDYLGRGKGKKGDLNDPVYNRQVRDWVMSIIPRDLQEFWSDDDSDRSKLAKLYAAYNWGAGNLRSFLRKKQKAGVDISNPDNWVNDLNPETRRYVKYLAFDEDIPDSSYTNEAFEEAVAKRGYMARGGNLFEMGGPESNSGWNIGASIIDKIKHKYLSDYADNGYVYSYPANPVELLGYTISPYAKIDGYGNEMLKVMPKEVTNARRALFAKNFGVNTDGKDYAGSIVESKYRPSVSSNPDASYYTIPIDDPKTRFEYLSNITGTAKFGFGEDENGKYLSVYDVWDLAPFSNKGNEFPGTTPPEIYDRFYQSEIPKIYSAYSMPGTDFIVPSSGMDFASGGKIHIKPENRGKFTALKKRTGHSASWFKAHGTPAQKKMAVFALNARKWKHGDGGFLDNYFYDGGDTDEPEKQNWFTRMMLGAAMAENPAVATASGWEVSPNGQVTFDNDSEGVRQLRENLPIIGAAGIAGMGLANPLAVGRSAALGLDTWGRYAMPSTFLKGLSYYVPKAAGALRAVSPWLDAGALSLWSAEAGKAAIDSGKRGRVGDAIGYGMLSALPMIASAPSLFRRRMAPKISASSVDIADPQIARMAEEEAQLARDFRTEQLGVDVPIQTARTTEWSPEELARLRAMAGDQPMNLDAYTPEQIAQAQAMMQADAPVIYDALAGNRSTAPTQTFLASAPTIAKTTESGYQIQRYPGYMLQSLMEGNPLEKQMGKNGTVSVNNIKALMKNAKKVDQAVVDKVIASEEFAGKKSIDYNQFRKAVQDELITYDRTPDTRYADYGIARLGMPTESGWLSGTHEGVIANNFLAAHPELDMAADANGNFFRPREVPGLGKIYDEPVDISEIEKIHPGWLREFDIKPFDAQTYTFSSSRIPNGSGKHYDANTLGHSRTYTTADEPDVLHVMESQSDWAQQRKGGIQLIDMTEENFLNDKAYFEQLIGELESKGISEEEIAPFRNELNKLTKNYKDHFGYNSKNSQLNHLIDNYTSRQIQENLRYAAEKGQKKMRYPTRETAAKIEGYPEREAYFDSEGNDITTSGRQMYEWSKEDQQAVSKLKDQRKRWDDLRSKYDLEWQGIENDLDPDDKLLVAIEHDNMLLEDAIAKGADETTIAYLRDGIQKNMAKYKDMTGLDANTISLHEPEIQINYLDNEISRLEAKQNKLLPGITKKTFYDYEDILRKYTEFPKQYQKLFRGANVRTVTDPKGNTWYEVDVPENYLQQEWKYSTGGILGKANQIYSGDISKIRQAIQNARARKK